MTTTGAYIKPTMKIILNPILTDLGATSYMGAAGTISKEAKNGKYLHTVTITQQKNGRSS